jgi:lysozyme family protein
MLNNFQKSLDLLLGEEKGFQDDPRDLGNQLPDGRQGCTNLGVTQAAWEEYLGHHVSRADMQALSIDKVSPFYKIKYWNPCYADVLPSGLDYCLFDFAVNHGTGGAVKILQQAIGCVPDGVIGPRTIQTIQQKDAAETIKKFTMAKEEYYKSLKTFSVFGNGWIARSEKVRQNSLNMVK